MAKRNRPLTTKSTTKAPRGRRYPEGYGALLGQFVVRPGLDLTKPIYEQVLELDRKERRRQRGQQIPSDREDLLRKLRSFRGRLPLDFKFDRDDANGR
jgi:hypothetical protein